MPESPELSRRERQIMDAVFALGEATVNEVGQVIPSPLTTMSVLRLTHILEEKGYFRRRPGGREVIYADDVGIDRVPSDSRWSWISILTFLWSIGFGVLILRLTAARWMLWSNEQRAIVLAVSGSPNDGRKPILHESDAAIAAAFAIRPISFCSLPYAVLALSLRQFGYDKLMGGLGFGICIVLVRLLGIAATF